MSDGNPDQPDRVIIRDNRKIDPVTGEVRKAAAAGEASASPAAGPVSSEEDVLQGSPTPEAALLDERTRDLQRLQAEYANYRRRAERDRLAAGDLAVGRTLGELLPVLDDLDRAREHGDLAGPLKAIADKLDAVVSKLGLVAFGAPGDPFDPAIHEAVMHDVSDAVSEPTCTTVMRKGYQHHDRLLRAAMVGVTDPETPGPLASGEQSKNETQADPTAPADPAGTAASNNQGGTDAQLDEG